MAKPPRQLQLSEVPQWVSDNYGIKAPTRQTVYNWTKVGKRGVVLRSAKKFGSSYTTERWLHEFAGKL
jgi:hypothetical protein